MSLFSRPDQEQLVDAYNEGKAKTAWVDVPVRLGETKGMATVRLIFASDAEGRVWFPIWIFVAGKEGAAPKLML